MEEDKRQLLPSTQAELVIFTQIQNEARDEDTETSHRHIQIDLPENIPKQLVGNVEAVDSVPNGTDVFVCGKCNRTFKQKSRYERHITNHPSETHYLCQTCNKTFTRKSHLEKHIRTHTEERRHICEICGAAFILPHHLVRHNLIHSGERPFKCEVCNKQFTRKAGLTQHQLVHTGARPFTCEIQSCGKQFTDRTTLRRHLLTHSSEKPFICKECNKTFRTKSACRKHYLRHFNDNDSYKCSICEEMFKSEEQLKTHSTVHEGKLKTGAHRCGFCLRVFKSQEDLDTHVSVHENGLVHSCSECAAKFYTTDDLVNHLKKHMEDSNNMTMKEASVMMNQEEQQQQQTNTIDEQHQQQQSQQVSKVLVVLQLPPGNLSNMKNEQGTLQVTNIQQLLGTAQIDKLVVTTDPISNSSSTVALELSQDQQQGIQQILQTTCVTQQQQPITTNSLNTFVGESPSPHSLDSTDLHATETFNEPIQNPTIQVSSHLNTGQSHPFVLTAIPQPPQPVSGNEESKYLIVPPPDLPSVMEKPLLYASDDNIFHKNKISKNRALESDSVFKSPTTSHTAQLVSSLNLFVDNNPNTSHLVNPSTQNFSLGLQDDSQASKSLFQHNTDYHNNIEDHELFINTS